MQIYLHRQNQQLGPFTEADVRSQLAAGTIALTDHVWWTGQAQWIPLGQSPFAASASPALPPVVPPPVATARIGSHPQSTTTSGLAIASLVCGLLCFPCVITVVGAIFTAVLAIILGHLGLAEIRRNPAVKGTGLAVSGLILGYIFTALFLLVMFIVCVFYSLGKELQTSLKNQIQMFEEQNLQDNDDTDSSTNSDSGTNAAPVPKITP